MKTLIHEEVYRGETLLKKMADKPLVICGCGAIGSNLIDNLARQGFTKFTVIDFDRIEDHNRNNQIWSRKEIGQLKVAMMKFRLFNDIGLTSCLDVSKKLDESNIGKIITKKDCIVVDAFDNSESRQLIKNYCNANNVDCLHIGLAQDYAEVIWNEEYEVPVKKGKDVCEYPLARNIAILSVVVGTESLIKYVDGGVKESYSITLKDFKIQRYEG